MIVALTGDGMAASLSALRNRNAAFMTRHLTVSRSLGTRHEFSRGVFCLRSLDKASIHYRLYSTSLPPVHKTEPPVTPAEPGIPLHQQRPRKVELRPGPVKPQPTAPAATSSPSKSDSVSATQNDTTSAAWGSKPSEGVILTAKHDVEEAARHGLLAPPPPDAGRIGKLIHHAKELFKFYWRGLKLIYTNSQRAQEMQERVKKGGPPLTRWEHRFLGTCKEDIIKLVPFALIILIAEEVIPLVVMYAPFILPSTCILPAQKQRIDEKRREKQQASAASMRHAFEHIRDLAASKTSTDLRHLLDGPGLAAVSGILGHSNYSVDILRMRTIRKHLTSVAKDDALLIQEGNGSRLTPSELVEALGERGIITEGLSFHQQQSRLRWWLTEVQKPGSTATDQTDSIARRVVLIARGVTGG